MSSKDESGAYGIGGFASALTLVFVILRLTGNIDWVWWKIGMPLEINLGLLLLVGIGKGIGEYRAERRRTNLAERLVIAALIGQGRREAQPNVARTTGPIRATSERTDRPRAGFPIDAPRPGFPTDRRPGR